MAFLFPGFAIGVGIGIVAIHTAKHLGSQASKHKMDKLKRDADALRQEAHDLGGTPSPEDQQAQTRLLALVSLQATLRRGPRTDYNVVRRTDESTGYYQLPRSPRCQEYPQRLFRSSFQALG